MNNIEYAWVIQRDDGKFFKGLSINGGFVFINSVRQAFMYCCDYLAKEEIEFSKLDNCKVVKVEIKVVVDE